jgi:Ca2+-binding EF-hand superfamily protein
MEETMTLIRQRHVRAALAGLVLAVAVPASYADGPLSSFKGMDANHDGKVSHDEHAAAARKMFATMDANKDGKVTAAEMDAAHEPVTGRTAKPGDMPSADKIKVIDTDGDGVLAAAEHAAGSRTMFDAMDTDKDGSLGEAELAAGHARMMKKAPQ